MASVDLLHLTEEQKGDLLCTYASLILYEENLNITEDNIVKLIKASGNSVLPYMPMLYAKAMQEIDIRSLLLSSSSIGTSPIGGEVGDTRAAETTPADGNKDVQGTKGPKKEEKEEEEEEDMGFSLFD